MDHLEAAQWPLDSGIWTVGADPGEIHLSHSALGNPVAPELDHADIAHVMNMRGAPGGAALFPPEFHYSPLDGTPLAASPVDQQRWVPPHGARAANAGGVPEAAGLKRTSMALATGRLRAFDAESRAQIERDLPPPGTYEFFSSTFGTVQPVLLALDIRTGALFAWLPASGKWQPMQAAGAQLISESGLAPHAWRAEMLVAHNSRILVPTEHGLASIVPDFLALQYTVDYVGNAPVVGAPLAFDNRVWAPIRHDDGTVQFVYVDANAQAGPPMRIEGQWDLGAMGAPVAYGRNAIWPCDAGQLRLQLTRDGSVVASMLPWPAGVVPHFEFGSVHMTGQGHLWQICFDSRIDSYVYVRLDVLEHEQVEALSPRMCSGTLNYRFATKLKTDPWIEPEHGDDGGVNTVVVPLLEVGRGAVLSLHIDSTASLSSLLNSTDRLRARLAYDDESSDIFFHTVAVRRPWDMRLFLHEGRLWAYHPELRHILGWEVQA